MVLLFRLLVGSALYVTIILLAAPFPRAAALMLVFPSLNGLSFLFASPASFGPMGRSMLLMPTINGALCAVYVYGFLAFAPGLSPDLLAWLLLACVTVLWVVVTSWDVVQRGIERQRAYAIATTLIGLLLVATALQFTGNVSLPRHENGFWSTILAWKVAIKIGLFVLCLFIFLVCITYFRISDAYRGVLSGLPVVPFAGLLSVAGDPVVDVDVRLATLRSMGVAIGIAPAVATWFIYALPRRWRNDQQPGSMRRLRDLIVGWALCGLAIAAITVALERLS
jgi:hypothetical protein